MNPLKAKIAALDAKINLENSVLTENVAVLKEELFTPAGLTIILGVSFIVGFLAAKKTGDGNFFARLLEASLIANRFYKEFN